MFFRNIRSARAAHPAAVPLAKGKQREREKPQRFSVSVNTNEEKMRSLSKELVIRFHHFPIRKR